jgi:glycosyltransferase involved in cell wall biosynthesis
MQSIAVRSLLLLTYHFPPSAASGAFRLLGFARHLPTLGWGVQVVAPPTLPWEPSDPLLTDRLPEGVHVHPALYSQAMLTKPVRKIWPYAFWLPTAWRVAERAVSRHRPDIILTSGPPHEIHLLGAYFRRRHGIPWVADFRDPWAVARPPQVHVTRRERAFEKLVIRHADGLVWNTPRVRDRLREAYPARADTMVAIENGFDPEGYPDRTRQPGDAGVVDVLHAGMVYMGRDPRPLFDALKLLQSRRTDGLPSIRISFLGLKQDFTVDLESEARRRGLEDSIRVEGHLPYEATLQRMVDADVLLLLDSPGRHMGVPAKLYEYLGAGRPVLALAERDGDIAAVLRHGAGTFRIVDPRQPGEIADALEQLVGVLPTTYRPADSATSPYVRRALAGRLARFLEERIDTIANRRR